MKVGPMRHNHPAAQEARTLYPSTRRDPSRGGYILKPGANNKKIGGMVTKGVWAGMPIYSLTLEERATCPSSCLQWRTCYGNNMHMMRRYRHGKLLEKRIVDIELPRLAKFHPDGFVVRLHILGDFYSLDYVTMWVAMLWLYPMMRIWGYTAHRPGTKIGDFIAGIRDKYWHRFAVRTSGGEFGPRTRVESLKTTARDRWADEIMCPQQPGKTESCGTCALCWATERPIVFVEH